MADTTFTSGTTITSAWLNDINDFVYTSPLNVKLYGAVGDGITDDTAAIQAALTAAYNSGAQPSRNVFFPAGTYIISDTLTCQSNMFGEGPFCNGTGTILKWTGSAAKVFNFPLYVSGWTFEGFRIDTTSVTSDTAMMYFALGLNGASFRDVEFKGYHTGASFGGTYANHDGIYIVGGSGATKYDMSQNRFERVFFLRCRDGITMSGDPASGGPGNGNTFDGCFSWCSRNTIKLFGANNTIINCEFNTESGQHTVVQSGGYAVGWTYIGNSWGTAASSNGNQPIYADTGGAAAVCAIFGGTVENSDGGGVPSIVRDAGPTGGKVYRYVKHGTNNSDSTVLVTDQMFIGQALSGNYNFYTEGTWTPTYTNLTVVLGAGAVVHTGKYTRIGNVVYWTAYIAATGGATTASTAGSTRINNLPLNQSGIATTCTASNSGTLASYGVGQGAIGGKNMFTPTWAAAAEGILISGFYFTDGTS